MSYEPQEQPESSLFSQSKKFKMLNFFSLLMLSFVDLQRILNTLDFSNYLFLKIGGFLLLFV